MPYPTRVEDVNLAAHLDNLRILRAVDEVRNGFLGMPTRFGTALLPGRFGGFAPGVAPLVAGYRVEFLRELQHDPDQPLEVTMWVCRLGRTSLDVAAQVRQRPGAPVAAQVITAVVLLDHRADSTPWPLSASARTALAAYQHPAPGMR